MAVITFANTKGGAGKTTAVLIIATELVRMGFSVAILDADPQHWISRWYKQLNKNAPAQLSVIAHVSASNIEKHIRQWQATADFVLVDLPGVCTSLLARAIGHSQYVLIPIQGSSMDAQGGANVIDLLRHLAHDAGIRIPHSVVLTRVNPIVTTRALQAVKELLNRQQVHLLPVPIIERAAFRDVFDSGETLYSMDPRRVNNLEKAQDNARLLAMEVLRRILPYVGTITDISAKLRHVA
jgi:chromosome partitioning protein